MKKVKLLIVLLFLISIFSFESANAVNSIGSSTYSSNATNGLLYRIYVTVASTNENIRIFWNGDFSTSNFFKIKANNQLAFCLDPDKQYSMGVEYRLSSHVGNSFLEQLYTWGKSNPKQAQIIIWALRRNGYFTANYSGITLGQTPDKSFFRDIVSKSLTEAGEATTDVNYKWIIPENACRCLDDPGANICNEYTPEVGNGKVTLYVDNAVYTYTDSEIDQHLSDCVTIASMTWDSKNRERYSNLREAKISKYRELFQENSGNYYQQKGTEYAAENKAEQIYEEITSTTPSTGVAIYAPYDDSGNIAQDTQYILAPIPSNLKPDCTNILGTMKTEGQLTDANLQVLARLFPNSKDTILSDNPRCRTASSDCNKQVASYIAVGRVRNKQYSAKRGNSKWVTTYKMISAAGGGYACPGCATAKKDFLTKYHGSCAEFMKDIDDPSSVLECVDNDHVTCSGGDGGCSPDDPYYPTCKPYPNCDPAVNLDNGKCASKWEGKAWFELSDSKTGTGDPNTSCYQNQGYAYNIENDIVSSKENEMSNSYCDVYCWESLTANMPWEPSDTGTPILAGQLFFWGLDYYNNVFATLETKRICWTKPKYDVFANDWNANEAAIAKAYTAYQNQVSYNNKSGWDSTEACKITADCLDLDNGEAGTTCCWNFAHTKCLSYSDATSCARHGDYMTLGGRAASCKSCPSGYHANGTSCEKDGTRYKRDAVGTGDTASTSYSECLESSPSENDIDNYDAENSRKSTLESAIQNRNNLKNSLERCISDSGIRGTNGRAYNNNIYNYTAWMKVKSNDQLNNKGVTDTSLSLSIDNESVAMNSPANGTRTYNCTNVGGFNVNNPCTNTGYYQVAYYPEFYWDYSGNASFKYTSQFYFHALKETAKIINQENFPVNVGKDDNLFYVLGYGIPTAFTYGTGFFDIGVEMGGFGHNKHFDLIENNSESKYGYSIKEYDCGYFVKNTIYNMECNYDCNSDTKICKLTADSPSYCPPTKCENCAEGDLDVIYRVIDMASGDTKRIFPSVDGDGRTPGSNWNAFIVNRATAYKNITTYDEVYDATPLYTIELTPTNIGIIRASNKTYRENGKDPYTSYYDPTNKSKITCNNKDDENKSCVSNYITELIKRNVIKSGKFKIESEGQRLNALNNYKTCYDVANPHC